MKLHSRPNNQCAVHGCHARAERDGLCLGHLDAVAAAKAAARLGRENAALKRKTPERPTPAPKPFVPLPGLECMHVDPTTGARCPFGRLMNPSTGEPLPGVDRCGLHA